MDIDYDSPTRVSVFGWELWLGVLQNVFFEQQDQIFKRHVFYIIPRDIRVVLPIRISFVIWKLCAGKE